MSLVLAIDTSTDVVVGLARDGLVLAEARNDDPRRHVEDLLPTIDQTVREAGVTAGQLTAIVVGLGPGPFTGLRVGIATARMLAAALTVPLHGVCALDAIAADWSGSEQPPTGEFLVATDARRREVYWARYAADGRRLDGPAVGSATALPALPVAGPGAALCPEHQPGKRSPDRLSGATLALVGLDLPTIGTEPVYLRRPDAVVPSGRKSVLPRALNRPGRR